MIKQFFAIFSPLSGTLRSAEAPASCLRRIFMPAALLACLSGVNGAAVSDEPPLRLSGVVYLGDLPTLVAEERGLFERHGLDLVVDYDHSGRETLTRLRVGETDFALMALTPFVLDRLSAAGSDAGEQPVILANVSHSLGLNHVVVLPESPVEQPAQLVGATIGVMSGTNADFLLSLFLTYHGIDPGEVTRRDLPTAEIGAALRAGEIDAGVIWEPWIARLSDEIGAPVRRFSVSSAYTARWVLVTRRRLVEERPEKAEALLRVYEEAIDFIDREPERARAFYAEHADLSAETVRANWQGLIYDLSLNWSLLTALQQQIEWARAEPGANASRELSVLSLVMPTPLRTVVPARVSIPRAKGETEGDR